jgi:putative membrane protein
VFTGNKNGIFGCRFFSRTIPGEHTRRGCCAQSNVEYGEFSVIKLLSRIAAVILFVIFFGFAAENTQEVTLHFFLNYEIRGPLVMLLLGFFAVGAALGVLAMTPTVFRHRRELAKHQKTLADMRHDNQARQAASAQPPLPGSMAIK